jgi:myo-inositol-1(or 4)-monophosphatase
VSTTHYKKTLTVVKNLANRVGDYLRRGVQDRKKIYYKGEVDLVTQFDKNAQTMIVRELTKKFPGYGILSEENISRNLDARIKWIVDPLDGTTNFAHGLPIWTVSIALEVEGEIVLGVVYDPTRREMFSAVKNNGAYVNRKKMRVSRIKKLNHALLITGFPYDIRRSRDNNLHHFCNFALRAQAVRRLGSAALDLCYTACGRFDGYWELKLSPWDQAAGSLILREAGGRITDFKGKKFNIYGAEVLGTNGLIHGQMMKVLKLVSSRQ